MANEVKKSVAIPGTIIAPSKDYVWDAGSGRADAVCHGVVGLVTPYGVKNVISVDGTYVEVKGVDRSKGKSTLKTGDVVARRRKDGKTSFMLKTNLGTKEVLYSSSAYCCANTGKPVAQIKGSKIVLHWFYAGMSATQRTSYAPSSGRPANGIIAVNPEAMPAKKATQPKTGWWQQRSMAPFFGKGLGANT